MRSKPSNGDVPSLGRMTRPGWSAVDLGVRLFCHGYPLASCSAHAISPQGVSVSKVLDALPSRAYLELEFDRAQINPPTPGRIPVYVDEVGTLGTDLLFTFPDEQHVWVSGLLQCVAQ